MGPESEPVECRLLETTDLGRGTALLDEITVTFSGYSSPLLSAILCREASRHRGLEMVVADCGGVPAGFVLVMIDPLAYQRAFLLRHPLIALRIALQRLKMRISKPTRRTPAPAAGSAPPGDALAHAASSWGDSGSEIARIVLVGVARRFRGRKIATTLYDCLFQQMAARGIEKIVARIDADNLPSIGLHRQTGWELRDFGACIEAIKCLGGQGRDPAPRAGRSRTG